MNMKPKVRSATIGVALALLASACSGGRPHGPKIGLQRIALDLAFRAERENKKIEPQQTLVATAIPSQAEYAISVEPSTFAEPAPPVTLPRRAPAICRTAGEGGVPQEAVTTAVRRPPTAGAYKIHRTGTFYIDSAVFKLQGPMPPKGEKEYRNVKVIPGSTDALGNKGPDEYEYEVYERVGDNYFSRTLHVTSGAIQLVKQVTEIGGRTVTFTPTPAITLVQFGDGTGTSWNSAGVDRSTGTSMVVQGVISKRANVDLCGKVYDSYMVQSTERVTNVMDQYSSQTDDAANQGSAATGGQAGKPNTYWVATQFGGLFIQEEFHTSTTLTVQVSGAPVPVTLKLDYTNTFDSIDPAGQASAS